VKGENKMKVKKLNELGRLAKNTAFPATILALTVGLISYSINNDERIREHREKLASTISMQYYLPVRNGGALAVMNGRISEERVIRNKLVEEVYENRYNLAETDDLEDESVRLK
jgi:hypothetical protein